MDTHIEWHEPYASCAKSDGTRSLNLSLVVSWNASSTFAAILAARVTVASAVNVRNVFLTLLTCKEVTMLAMLPICFIIFVLARHERLARKVISQKKTIQYFIDRWDDSDYMAIANEIRRFKAGKLFDDV